VNSEKFTRYHLCSKKGKLPMKKLLVLPLAGIFLLTVTSTVLAAFTFTNTVFPGSTLTWTHNLANGDFNPGLSGGEVIDVTDALLFMQLDFTLSESGSFGMGVCVSVGDGIYLDTLAYYGSANQSISDYAWSIDFSDIDYPEPALNAIEDKSYAVQLFSNLGSITNVDSSTLSGIGTIVPIPGAVWLLGSGLVGIVGIRRKFSSKSG
jgi:hypothetical protein